MTDRITAPTPGPELMEGVRAAPLGKALALSLYGRRAHVVRNGRGFAVVSHAGQFGFDTATGALRWALEHLRGEEHAP